MQRSQSRHIEVQLTDDRSIITIRSHRYQPEVYQLAREFPKGMHSQEFQILAPENQFENTFFLSPMMQLRVEWVGYTSGNLTPSRSATASGASGE